MYTPGLGFQKVKDVTQSRSTPYILRSAPDNALIMGMGEDNYGKPLKECWVDRLTGPPFVPELLREWHPLPSLENAPSAEGSRIGDYTYLVPVTNESGELQLALIQGEDFSLLPLEKDIPTNGPWGRIGYEGTAKTDRERGYAWIQGSDLEAHIFLVRIAYSKALEGGKAPVRVYYTEPLVDVSDYPGSMTSQDAFVSPVGILLPDGRMALVGGVFQDNYTPIPHNWLLYPGIPRKAAFLWGWIAAGMAVLLAGILLARRKGRKERGKKAAVPEADKEAPAKLMARIEQLMEEQQFYLRKDLRLTDIAAELGTNSTYISACVNSITGSNFPTYLNGYRVRRAQALMKEHPDWLLAQVAEESGFPNETTFLRNFKAQTGLSPSEWRNTH